MDTKVWVSGILAIAFSSMLAGAVLYAQFVPSEIMKIPVVTERVILEQPIIDIVEVPETIPLEPTYA